jgi:hypothetical protein
MAHCYVQSGASKLICGPRVTRRTLKTHFQSTPTPTYKVLKPISTHPNIPHETTRTIKSITTPSSRPRAMSVSHPLPFVPVASSHPIFLPSYIHQWSSGSSILSPLQIRCLVTSPPPSSDRSNQLSPPYLPFARGGDDVGVLDRQTYRGGTRCSRLCGEDRD